MAEGAARRSQEQREAARSGPRRAQESPGAALGEPRVAQDTSTMTLFLATLVCRFALANLVSSPRAP